MANLCAALLCSVLFCLKQYNMALVIYAFSMAICMIVMAKSKEAAPKVLVLWFTCILLTFSLLWTENSVEGIIVVASIAITIYTLNVIIWLDQHNRTK
jgi:hypothetical protein